MKSILIIIVTIFCSLEIVSQKLGDSDALNINNIYLPMNNAGILADANGQPYGFGGQFQGHIFLFSGGFFLSGYSNGQLWANAVASSSLVQDYIQGTVGNPNDSNAVLYKLSSSGTILISDEV